MSRAATHVASVSKGATAAAGLKVNIVQGEHFVSDNPDVVLTTLLGSCVAACMRDPLAGVGGMNHFLLPGGRSDGLDMRARCQGVHAMEVLVNALLSFGARRERLEVKLFGGASMIDGLTDVGGQNADFAERFILDEGLNYLGGSLRGEHGRKLQFWPVSGRARQSFIQRVGSDGAETDRVASRTSASQDAGSVELF